MKFPDGSITFTIAEQLPVKQGLKLEIHYIEDGLIWFIAEQLPVKQGLKLFVKELRNFCIFIAEQLPIKQGLKQTNPTSISSEFVELQNSFQ